MGKYDSLYNMVKSTLIDGSDYGYGSLRVELYEHGKFEKSRQKEMKEREKIEHQRYEQSLHNPYYEFLDLPYEPYEKQKIIITRPYDCDVQPQLYSIFDRQTIKLPRVKEHKNYIYYNYLIKTGYLNHCVFPRSSNRNYIVLTRGLIIEKPFDRKYMKFRQERIIPYIISSISQVDYTLH